MKNSSHKCVTVWCCKKILTYAVCVCVSGFLRDLCELLLYLLLPPGDFHNKNMRYFLRVSAHKINTLTYTVCQTITIHVTLLSWEYEAQNHIFSHTICHTTHVVNLSCLSQRPNPAVTLAAIQPRVLFSSNTMLLKRRCCSIRPSDGMFVV